MRTGELSANVGRNINLTAGEATRSLDEAHRVTGSNGWLSSKTKTTRDTLSETLAQGTTLSGNTTVLRAGTNAGVPGGDIRMEGSNVVSTQGTTLTARNNVSIEAGRNTQTESHFKEEKTSGVFSGGGIGFTIGNRMQSNDAKYGRASAHASTVGSTNGNVDIKASNTYRQVGSNVVAPEGDIAIARRKSTSSRRAIPAIRCKSPSSNSRAYQSRSPTP